ncbi:MAG: ATP-binding cassette domain-containing protein, partial [Clostridia bacterium]|nr:ATP-binding cassette domain-containing protein [Clostridia bacterium]
EQVRADCGVSRDGSNAKNISLAAQSYGFKVEAYRRSPEVIREKGPFPCIIHWNFNHFVVLNGFKGKYAYINDPARGFVKVDEEEFDKSFTGITVVPVPGPDFHPEGKRKSTLTFARKRLIGAGAAVVFVMLTTIISYMFGIVTPIMNQVFMDRLLTGINHDWLYPFIGMMIALGVLQVIVKWVQTVYSLKINGKMSLIGSASYIWKVLHMPMEFFSQRMAGDIQQRRSTNESIASTLVNTLAPLALNTIMMVFYLVLMLRRSLILTAIGISTIVLNIFMSRIISEKRINITRVLQRDSGKLVATTISGIEMVETIKSSGAERGFFRKWAGYQASVNAQNVKATKTNELLGTIPMFFGTLAGYAVLVLGVWFIMQGEFTLGVLQMFQGFLTSFMEPAMTFISAGQNLQEMRTQMERVEDVMEYPTDKNVLENEDSENQSLRKLRGNVELRNVTFGYSKLANPLIQNFSITMKPGSRIAFVGASGSGKSTLAKLISGLYDPWEGEILFDGKPRAAYPRAVMTGSVAVVDQDITLFEDTIAANIK